MSQVTLTQNSKPISTAEDGTETCSFCGAQIRRETKKLFRTEHTFVIRCSCDGAKAYWHAEALKDPYSLESLEETQRLYRLEQMREESNIPARWNTRTFEAFEVNEKNREAYEVAKEYAETFDPKAGRGLLFTGSVGTGKTHLCAAISLVLLGKEYSVIFGTVTSLLGKIRGAFDSDRISERQVMDKFCRCKLLVIDDLGKEKSTEWVEQTLYEIINSRYEDNKSTVITTNMAITDIRTKYPNNGDAIMDRILEMCDGVEMKWDSWRRRGL